MATYAPQSLGIQAPSGGFQTGGWYAGRQFWNGSLGDPGQFHPDNPSAKGAAPVQNTADANYLAKQGDTTAPQRVVTSNPTPAPTTTSTTGGGIPNISAPAPFDLVGVTNSAYNTPEIQAEQKAISDRESALATAQAGINDNPFYSEATRVGKSQQLTQEANNDIKVHQDNLSTLSANAQIKVNAALGQYNINRQAYQDTLSQFNNILNAGGLLDATPQDLSNYSVSTGIPLSVLQGMQDHQKSADTKLQIYPSTDAAGNVTITAIDKNTGKIISQSSAGDVGKGFKGGSGGKTSKTDILNQIKSNLLSARGGDHYVNPDDYAAAISDAVQAGYTEKNADVILGIFKNPQNKAYYLP